jgi:biotin carboxylase
VGIFVKRSSLPQVKKHQNLGGIVFTLIAKPLNGSGSEGVRILLGKEDLIRLPKNHITQ